MENFHESCSKCFDRGPPFSLLRLSDLIEFIIWMCVEFVAGYLLRVVVVFLLF